MVYTVGTGRLSRGCLFKLETAGETMCLRTCECCPLPLPPLNRKEMAVLALSSLSWVVKEMLMLLWGPYYQPGVPAPLADHGPLWVVGGGPARTEVHRFTRSPSPPAATLRAAAENRLVHVFPKALDSVATDIRSPLHHKLGR